MTTDKEDVLKEFIIENLNTVETKVSITRNEVYFSRIYLSPKFNTHHHVEIEVDCEKFGSNWMDTPRLGIASSLCGAKSKSLYLSQTWEKKIITMRLKMSIESGGVGNKQEQQAS